MPGARVGDLEVAYELGGSGPPVLLVAGTGYPGATWPPGFVESLRPHFTVVTFDHRGTGRTPGTPDRYTTRLLAGDAAGLLGALDVGPTHVVGHSMGGRVAQWLALDAPDAVRSLVLVGTGAGPTDRAVHQSRGLPVQTAVRLAELGYEDYVRDLQRRTFFTDDFAGSNPEAVAWLFEAFWEHRPPLEDYVKHVVARQEHDTVDRLAEIAVPALVVVGGLDTHAGATGSHVEQSRFLAEHLPHAELCVVPGVKHGLFWEHPAETAELIGAWLRRQT